MQYYDSGRRYQKLRWKWLFWLFLLSICILLSREKEAREAEDEEEMKASEPVQETETDDYIYLEESPEIRVVLQAGNYDNLYHARVEIAFLSGGYILTGVNGHWEKEEMEAGRHVTIGIGDDYDIPIEKDMLVAAIARDEEGLLEVCSIERSRQVCSYYGRLEVTREEEGLLLINALPLETYLCSVVPSEMPASYEEEALKAQAILARTYAYKYLIEPAYEAFQAHVDDSTAFQVYGNIDVHASSSKAVADTAGILLFSGKSLAQVYYYSTSCGFGTDATVWGGEGESYLQARRIGAGTLQTATGSISGEEAEQYYLERLKAEQVFRNMIVNPFVEGYEAEEGWYRWSAEGVEVNADALLARLKERYQANPNVILTKNKNGAFVSKDVKALGQIKNITVLERGGGGICKSVVIEGSEQTYKVLLEYNIRYVLNGAGTTVTKADGTSLVCSTLLPSAFFYLDTVHLGQNVISYNIYGGGYGHGVGMSQNGANRMAQEGLLCQEILETFFPKTIFVNYEEHF